MIQSQEKKPGMRWAFWIAILYGLLLVILIVPSQVLLLTSAKDLKDTASFLQRVREAFSPFSSWGFWGGIGALILAQAALLTLPVSLRSGRPVKKMPVMVTFIAAAFMTGLLFSGLVFTIIEVVNNDLFSRAELIFCAAFISGWLLWAWVFWRWSKKNGPEELLSKIRQFLFRGSVLELLVAVPCHIYARQRTDCCAGFGTFVGIIFGVAVMLFSFGPGVYFLYAKRMKELRRQEKPN